MSYTVRGSWQCEFTEVESRTPLPHKLTFASADNDLRFSGQGERSGHRGDAEAEFRRGHCAALTDAASTIGGTVQAEGTL